MPKNTHSDRHAIAAAAAAAAARPAAPRAEPLEPRRLLAGIEAGILVARGTAGGDIMYVRRSGADDVIVTTNGIEQTFDSDDFSAIRVDGGDGQDHLTMNTSFLPCPVTLNGGAHEDVLVGRNGAEILLGGAGNDTIRALGGDDSLVGGLGDDSLDGGDGFDTVDGGPGDDVIVNAERTPAAPNIRIADRILIADGSWGQDSLSIVRVGADDVIVAVNEVGGRFDMDDFDGVLLRGHAGFDQLFSHHVVSETLTRKVTLEGGAGSDTLEGSAGDDVMRGGDGNDFLFGAISGNDALFGNGGNDVLFSGEPSFLDGGDGDDYLNAENDQAGDTLLGGSGNDRAEIDPGDHASGVETFI